METDDIPATGTIDFGDDVLNMLKSSCSAGPAGSMLSFRISITNAMAKTGRNTELAKPCIKQNKFHKYAKFHG